MKVFRVILLSAMILPLLYSFTMASDEDPVANSGSRVIEQYRHALELNPGDSALGLQQVVLS